MSQLEYPFPESPALASTIEVADGVHWLHMALPFALDHINLWLLEDGDELVVVDAGYGTSETRTAWSTVLDRDPRPLSRLIVTHHHPDHLGLATWLCARNNARLYMTLGEFLSGQALWHQIPGYRIKDMLAQYHSHGLDETRTGALDQRGNAYGRGIPEMPHSYHRIHHGDQFLINGRSWEVMIGYGHSPEHASLYCAELGVLISGDMLLPRISTNISVYAATPDDDPLSQFLDSIRELSSLPADTLVLPSHGKPFRGIQPRVEQLVIHHRERCADLQAACAQAKTAGEVLATLFPRQLDTHQVMFAMGEAIAHLNHLEQRGILARQVDADGLNRFINIAQKI